MSTRIEGHFLDLMTDEFGAVIAAAVAKLPLLEEPVVSAADARDDKDWYHRSDQEGDDVQSSDSCPKAVK